MDKARGVLLWAMAVIGGAACLLQVYLNMTGHLDHTPLWRLGEYVSYFTNTTGLLATAVAIAALVRPASSLAQPGAVTATAVYILVVAVTYEWLLKRETHGLQSLANLGLHRVLPTLTVLLWLATPKAGLSWREPLAWLAYPAAYMAWILARGATIHRYPYFFADVDKLGYPRALLNGADFLLTFYVLGLAAVAIGRIPLTRTFPFRFGPKAANPEA